MVGMNNLLSSGVGVGAGLGSTLLIRHQFDRSGETTLMRPSVLWGLGTGAAALTLPMLMGRRSMSGMMGEIIEDYGEAALTAGTFSAFSPKGGGVQLPTL